MHFENKFLNHIKKSFENDNQERLEFHISDLGKAIEGEGCLRQLYLRLTGAEQKEHGIGKLLMFSHGNKIHETINQLLRNTNFGIISTERACKFEVDGNVFYGRYDVKIKEDNNKLAIVDYKTIRGNAFNYLNEAKSSHIAQIRGYLMATNIDKGYIVYIDREGQNGFRLFPVFRNDEEIKQLARKCIVAKEKIMDILEPKYLKKELKTKTNFYIKNPWQCSYCDYYGITCEGAISEETNINNNEIIAEIKSDELIIHRQDLKEHFEDLSKFE